MALEGTPVEIGDHAPEFTLRDHHNVEISLSTMHGRAVLLVFYPLAFTGVCSGELTLIQSEIAAFQNERTQVVAISVDSPYSLRAFADREGLQFPLLSDFWPHGAVARSYGVFDSVAGVATRATFLIDATGVVRWKVLSDLGHPRNQADYHAALANLYAAEFA
ncbi:MAG TPA: peroxiredoxin [Sporichthyaceae bacterium]|jgi:peroxiredoxin|nr:peroxiredoxin [Sporichthyaceae bacterium]